MDLQYETFAHFYHVIHRQTEDGSVAQNASEFSTSDLSAGGLQFKLYAGHWLS
jgi:hypothetical protein